MKYVPHFIYRANLIIQLITSCLSYETLSVLLTIVFPEPRTQQKLINDWRTGKKKEQIEEWNGDSR